MSPIISFSALWCKCLLHMYEWGCMSHDTPKCVLHSVSRATRNGVIDSVSAPVFFFRFCIPHEEPETSDRQGCLSGSSLLGSSRRSIRYRPRRQPVSCWMAYDHAWRIISDAKFAAMRSRIIHIAVPSYTGLRVKLDLSYPIYSHRAGGTTKLADLNQIPS